MPRAKSTTKPATEQPETFNVTELEQLRVLSDPLRMRVLNNLFQEPLTVKQVADRLEVPATKLYYHVNELERIGLVKVVETRVKSGIIEKYYRMTAGKIQVSRELLRLTQQQSAEASTYGEVLASIFEAVADDLRQSVAGGLLTPTEDSAKESVTKLTAIGRTNVRLKRSAASRLAKKLSKLLMEEMEAADDEAGEVEYGFALAFFPINVLDAKGDVSND